MDEAKKKENEEYLKENLGIVKKLRGNIKAIRQYTKLFNELCPTCKALVMRNPKMSLEEYCYNCQKKAEARMEKVKELIR